MEVNMLSNCVVVGRVAEAPTISKSAKGNSIAHMVVECDRPFRNEDGTLVKDKFKVFLWRGIAEECEAQCELGSLVAIKGRLQANNYEREDKQFYNCEIIAEKVSYV